MAPNKPNKQFANKNHNKGSKPFNKEGKQAFDAQNGQKKVVEKKKGNEVNTAVVQQKQTQQVKKVQKTIVKQKQGKKVQPQKKDDKKDVKSDSKKDQNQSGIKKQKQVKAEVVESDESSDIEIENDDFLDGNFERQNEILGELSQMKKTNTKKDKKDKERKVTEFKFRILDMLEIFIKKTKNPQIFIQSLSQILQCVKDNSNDKEKQTFVEKICQIVRRFFERHIKMLPEYKDNIEECFVEVVKVLAKEPKKSINTALTFASISLFKIRTSMNISDNSLLLSTFEKALEKSALKKEICYTEEFYKEVIRNSSDIAFKLLKSLLQYALLNKDGGAKDKNRQFILNLLNYTIRNPAVQELIKQKPTDTLNGLMKITSVFAQQEEFKKKKIGILNKYVEIFTTFASIFKDCKIAQKQELQSKLNESVANWPEADHNLKSIQKKISEKCVF